ncbi:MAG: type II toxin-antitoxin system RelE/ParE family toxin [Brumimicrobium sp.]|nr:type II toxin-antitoxin system RelE/ParE family toxin [Brumimicrobium sp.]
MEAIREIIYFKNHFEDFFDSLDEKTKNKVDEILYFISIIEQIPTKYLKKIVETKDLFEIRVEHRSNIYRIFCCFDEGNLVVLFNGFQKKTQKTPKNKIEKALKIKKEYFELKNK